MRPANAATSKKKVSATSHHGRGGISATERTHSSRRKVRARVGTVEARGSAVAEVRERN